MPWLPWLPWLRGAWLRCACLRWLRGVRGRRLLRKLGTVPHLLGSATWRMNDKT